MSPTTFNCNLCPNHAVTDQKGFHNSGNARFDISIF